MVERIPFDHSKENEISLVVVSVTVAEGILSVRWRCKVEVVLEVRMFLYGNGWEQGLRVHLYGIRA